MDLQELEAAFEWQGGLRLPPELGPAQRLAVQRLTVRAPRLPERVTTTTGWSERVRCSPRLGGPLLGPPPECAPQSRKGGTAVATMPPRQAVIERLENKRPRLHDDVHAQESHSHALDLLVLVFEVVCGCVEVPLFPAGFSRVAALSHLQDCLAGRSTATLLKRGQSLLMFIRWSRTEGITPFPLREAVVHRYVSELRMCKAPATRANAFLEAVNFGQHVMMLPTEGSVVSPRVRGAAARSFERKRILTQRDPLTVSHVRTLENHLFSSEGPTAVLAGFVLFLVYARCRHSDAQRLEHEPVLVGPYLEAGSCRTKTSSRSGRRRRLLPIAAPSEGIVGPWAERWMMLREQHGLKVGHGGPLMPCPAKAGWSGFQLTSFETGLWLKEVSQAFGRDENLGSRNLGSHSCKATGLSWAAKAGMDHDVRKLLGYHTSSKDETMLLYSRSAMAAPLRAFSELLRSIRNGSFDPDFGMSGQWHPVPPPSDPMGQDLPEAADLPSLDDGSRDGTRDAEASGAVPSDWQEAASESSSSPVGDSAEDPDSNAEEADAQVAINVVASAVITQPMVPWPADRILMHMSRGTFHVLKDGDPPMLACGRVVSDAFMEVPDVQTFLSPRCRVCETAFAARS